MVSGIIVEQGY